MPETRPSHAPPGVWKPAVRVIAALVNPLERFLHIQAASGILLLIAALVALIWANSPFRRAYEQLWHLQVSVGVGTLTFAKPLEFWINDGLMVVFFFVVGLEIRREIHQGELSDLKRAALPIAAAVGGMLVPALIYISVNRGMPARSGWGVPMATDIAFAVGVLALLGKRAPAAVRVLLLALAIIDDIGAILVIAIFYASGFSWIGIGIAIAGLATAVGLRAIGVRRPLAYVIPGIVLWAGLLVAGVHPTIAGVILGLLTPARPWYGEKGFLAATKAATDEFRERADRDHAAHDLLGPLSRVAEARREAVAPVVRLEAALHPWVAYGIMPLFALANAGVDLTGIDLRNSEAERILAGVVLGLAVGKPCGVLAASAIVVRLGIATRPRGATWRGITVVGMVAGIGFTMAIFIADLAFKQGSTSLATAKVGVLVASLLTGVVALLAGRVLLPLPPAGEKAITVGQAESTTAE